MNEREPEPDPGEREHADERGSIPPEDGGDADPTPADDPGPVGNPGQDEEALHHQQQERAENGEEGPAEAGS